MLHGPSQMLGAWAGNSWGPTWSADGLNLSLVLFGPTCSMITELCLLEPPHTVQRLLFSRFETLTGPALVSELLQCYLSYVKHVEDGGWEC